MADGTVVVTLLRVREPQLCDHVLVPVMRKLDRKLQLRRRIPKNEPRLILWRSFRVTNRADRRPRAFEKLRPVTTHTRVVIRVILDVGKSRGFGPVFCRNLVTSIAGCLMFGC